MSPLLQPTKSLTSSELSMILDKSPRQHTGVKPKPDHSIYSTDTALQNVLNNVDWVPKLDVYINTQGWNDAVFLEREFTVKQMWEAASSNSCDPVVFPMAVSIFDRYCSKVRINLQEYLTVGMTCLLVSSKINMTKPLRERTLLRSLRPDHLLQEKSLINMEFKLYNALDWIFCVPTPLEFFEHLAARRPAFEVFRPNFVKMMKYIFLNYVTAFARPALQTASVISYLMTVCPYLYQLVPDWEMSLFTTLQCELSEVKFIRDQLISTINGKEFNIFPYGYPDCQWALPPFIQAMFSSSRCSLDSGYGSTFSPHSDYRST
ncbi:hypothetical protein FO519_008183 [Halicephalobus sp. NKZ332]|nr:hypothetical protein FO519_008183 [Halicephalobus sp. NKZ332]